MFAVIKTGGKQYRVAADDVIEVEKLAVKAGEIVTFPVLMLGGDKTVIGAPMVAGAAVAAEVVEEIRGAKVIAFKKRRRKNSKRKRGHRQMLTVVRITEILTDGKQPTKKARPKPEAKPKAEDKPAKAGEEAEAKAEKSKAKAPAPKTAKPAKGKGKKK
jgi:large subunit ribosomal protein L21